MMKTVAYLVTAGLLAASTAFAGPVEMISPLPEGRFVACRTQQGAIDVVETSQVVAYVEAGECGIFDSGVTALVDDPDHPFSSVTIISGDGDQALRGYVITWTMEVKQHSIQPGETVVGKETAAICPRGLGASQAYSAMQTDDLMAYARVMDLERCEILYPGYTAQVHGQLADTYEVTVIDRGRRLHGYMAQQFLR